MATNDTADSAWFEDDEEDFDEDLSVREYDITSSPNDFNVKTIFDFIESGAVKIPGFQRHYVWDQKRASKLIESVIIGIPIPQVFLYEEARNKFLVIDGQQRLLTLYFFIKQRFPRNEKRPALRQIFDEEGKIPDAVLHDESYFRRFGLQLPEYEADRPNRLNDLTYGTLADYKTTFEMRTIRNIIIKQNFPDDDSSIYEIFNRLNSGGVNLAPQEIRSSLYHSDFYALISRLNASPAWRRLLGVENPDLHMKDVEIILRSFAMALAGEEYKPSLKKFLNSFSRSAKKFDEDRIRSLHGIFFDFVERTAALRERPFHNRKTNRFNVPMFEAVFAAATRPALSASREPVATISDQMLDALAADAEFTQATQLHTTGRVKVARRLERARAIILNG